MSTSTNDQLKASFSAWVKERAEALKVELASVKDLMTVFTGKEFIDIPVLTKSTVNTLTDGIATLSSGIVKKHDELRTNLTSELNKLATQLKGELESGKLTAQQSIEEYKNQASTLYSNYLKQLSSYKEDITKQVGDLQDTYTKTKQDIASLAKQTEGEVNQHRVRIESEVQSTLTQIDSKFEGIKQQLLEDTELIKGKVAKAKTDLDHVLNHSKLLEARTHEAKDQILNTIEEYKGQVTKLLERTPELSEITKLNSIISSSSKMTKIREELVKLKEQIGDIPELADLKTQLTSAVEKANKSIEELGTKVTNVVEGELTTLNANLATSKGQMATLTNKLKSLSSQLTAATDAYNIQVQETKKEAQDFINKITQGLARAPIELSTAYQLLQESAPDLQDLIDMINSQIVQLNSNGITNLEQLIKTSRSTVMKTMMGVATPAEQAVLEQLLGTFIPYKNVHMPDFVKENIVPLYKKAGEGITPDNVMLVADMLHPWLGFFTMLATMPWDKLVGLAQSSDLRNPITVFLKVVNRIRRMPAYT